MNHADATPRHRPTAARPRWLRRVPGAIAAVALMGAAAASHAEALAIELPSMRTPIEAAPPSTPTTPAAAEHATLSAPAPQVQREPERALTRQEVREALKRARAANIVSPTHEIGDTNEVLAAREAFYALQTEAILAQYAAEQREQELRASLEADLALRQALLDETVAAYATDDEAAATEETADETAAAATEPAEPVAAIEEDAAVAFSQPTEQAYLDEAGHAMAMREHEIVVTPDTTVSELLTYLDEAGDPDAELTLSVAEATEADEVD